MTFLLSTIDSPILEQITEEKLRKFFFDGRVERKWSTVTFMGYYKSIKVFLDGCVKERFITTNPILDVEVPKLEKRLPTKLTKQESQKILEHALNMPYPYKFLRYRNHAIFATFIFSVLRKKELINLHYTDVDLENLSLFVRQGKGAKDRIIPISYTLAQSLKRYLEERKRLNKSCPQFFTSLNRNMGINESGLKNLVNAMVHITGIKFTLHKLRHTFATLMLEGGCDIYALSKMLGHNDIKTTTIYLFATAEHLKLQMNKHPMN